MTIPGLERFAIAHAVDFKVQSSTSGFTVQFLRGRKKVATGTARDLADAFRVAMSKVRPAA